MFAQNLTHVSNFRPGRAPPVSNSPKKGRHSCQSRSADVSNFGARCGPCQSSGRGGAPVSKASAQLSKFRHRSGPCVNLSNSRRCGGPRVSKFPHPVGPCVNLSKCRRCGGPCVSKFPVCQNPSGFLRQVHNPRGAFLRRGLHSRAARAKSQRAAAGRGGRSGRWCFLPRGFPPSSWTRTRRWSRRRSC